MCVVSARALALSALLSLTVLGPVGAEDIPQCRAEIAGQLSVQADVACECRYFTESFSRARPPATAGIAVSFARGSIARCRST
jgi:hypothetical protein